MKLIRMISSISKWNGSRKVNRTDATICGDAISDLRTTDNKLSVWIGDNEEDIDDAIVALALSRDDVQKVECFELDEKKLSEMEITTAEEKGKVGGLNEAILCKHRNLVEIDYKRLGILADYMACLASNEQNRITRTPSSIKELLRRYEREGKIKRNMVKPHIREKMGW